MAFNGSAASPINTSTRSLSSTLTTSTPLSQNPSYNLWQRHQHHHALPKIPALRQQHRLAKESKRQHVRCHHGELQLYNGAEICELVGLLILDTLSKKTGNSNISQYRDNGLALVKNVLGPEADHFRRTTTSHFKQHGLSISIKSKLKIVDFLDISLNLTKGTFYPYRKPNNEPLNIHAKSNHPPSIIKHLLQFINQQICDLFLDKEAFNKTKPKYENALKSSGYSTHLQPHLLPLIIPIMQTEEGR